jgi:hypothetical protein
MWIRLAFLTALLPFFYEGGELTLIDGMKLICRHLMNSARYYESTVSRTPLYHLTVNS